MPEKNIKLTIEYEGSAYAGWQIQDNQRTIQGEIAHAIRQTTGKTVTVTGAGRTDAGVHALGQVANFRINHDLEPSRYAGALNYYLDDDIRVQKSEEVSADFHARKSALSKRYRYLLSTQRSALYKGLRWEYEKTLDFSLLKEAADVIAGKFDFSPFCVVNSRKENNVCWIRESKWIRFGPLLVYEIQGNRFLHHMVRSLVGAMVNLATRNKDRHPENLTLAQFADIIRSASEQRVVFTAPAHGLYLVSVLY